VTDVGLELDTGAKVHRRLVGDLPRAGFRSVAEVKKRPPPDDLAGISKT
jgi:hypothetical protein